MPGWDRAPHSVPSKSPEEALPADDSRVEDSARIGKKPFAKLSRLPGILRHVERHVNHDRRADNILARDAAPETAVEGVAAIVAHGEITVIGNAVGQLHIRVTRRSLSRRGGLGWPGGVILVELPTVDKNRAIVNLDGITGKTDRKST